MLLRLKMMIYLLCVSQLLHSCGNEQDQTKTKTINNDVLQSSSSFELLDGVDQITKARKKNCFDQPTISSDRQYIVRPILSKLTVNQVINYADIKRIFNLNFGIGVPQIGLDLGFDFARNVANSNKSLFLVFKSSHRYRIENRQDLILKERYLKNIEGGNSDIFFTQCGTDYVDDLTYGVETNIVLKMDFSTLSEKNKFGIDLSLGNLPLFDVPVSPSFGVKFENAKNKYNFKTSVNIESIGNANNLIDFDQIAKLFKAEMNNETSDAAASLYNHLKDTHDKIFSIVDNQRKQDIEDYYSQNNRNAVVLDYKLANYLTIENRLSQGFFNNYQKMKLEFNNLNDDVQDLYQLYENLLQIYNQEVEPFLASKQKQDYVRVDKNDNHISLDTSSMEKDAQEFHSQFSPDFNSHSTQIKELIKECKEALSIGFDFRNKCSASNFDNSKAISASKQWLQSYNQSGRIKKLNYISSEVKIFEYEARTFCLEGLRLLPEALIPIYKNVLQNMRFNTAWIMRKNNTLGIVTRNGSIRDVAPSIFLSNSAGAICVQE